MPPFQVLAVGEQQHRGGLAPLIRKRGLAIVFSDLLDRPEPVIKQLRHLAGHDALTGLFNRRVLEQRL